MGIIQFLQSANGNGGEPEEQIDDVVRWIKERIVIHEARVALYRKALVELEEIGAAKFNRINKMLRDGVDPDQKEEGSAVMKVGPHGPGCECVVDEDGDVVDKSEVN